MGTYCRFKIGLDYATHDEEVAAATTGLEPSIAVHIMKTNGVQPPAQHETKENTE